MADYYNNGNGYQQNSGQQPMYNPPQYQPQTGMEPPPGYVQKSRTAAGVLAILLGIAYLLLTVRAPSAGPFADPSAPAMAAIPF